MLPDGRPIDDPPIDDPPPIDPRPADSPDRPDSEDDRGGIDENFCQPPLLPSRPGDEPPALPDLDADSALELPRASKLRSELLSEVWLERWNPLFELLFPGRETSRPLPIDLPFAAVLVFPRAEKKC